MGDRPAKPNSGDRHTHGRECTTKWRPGPALPAAEGHGRRGGSPARVDLGLLVLLPLVSVRAAPRAAAVLRRKL
jgi:hypothetical protein